ncbi:MAG: carboxypeptidase regulatory-like domain-containing protein [Chloroflexi bacterium]|nr:carboxypeptidase regulatory-like domain-containing protein [Chloroflexota bacterium]
MKLVTFLRHTVGWRFLPLARLGLSASLLAIVLAVIALGVLFRAAPTGAQGLVVQDLTGATEAQNLAEALVGGGVAVSNVTYTGDERAGGLFGGGAGIIGFESGVLLSSGQAQDVVGPNNLGSQGTGLGESGDPDLTALSGNNTFDAAVLEFDFVPTTNLVVFEYVFASEEYNEFVGSQFNDVFAFYANGMNCAVVPNPANPVASLPVSINTINNGDSNTSPTNPGLYINNDPFNPDSTGSTVGSPRDTQMDGLTKVLTCSAQVQPGVTNHMKLAIADASDSSFDSAVFIKGGSFVAAEGRVSGRVLGPPPDSQDPDALVLLEGAVVTVCSIPPCPNSTTNAIGEFVVTDLPPGNYHVIAYPPPGRNDLLPADKAITLPAGQSLDVGDMIMKKAVAPPPGFVIDSIGSIGGAPVIKWDAASDFSIPGCEGGSGTWVLKDSAGNVLDSGTLTESPPGTYNGTIGPLIPYHGPATLSTHIDCPDGSDEDNVIDLYIDPSGYVRTVQGEPIANATVTLFRSDIEAGPFTIVPNGSAIMSPSNRTNPDLTDADGHFGWDVIAGFYKVRAEKAGCVSPNDPGQAYVETDVLVIPPPVTDLALVLDCGGAGLPIEGQLGSCLAVTNVSWSFANPTKVWSSFDPDLPDGLQGFTEFLAGSGYFVNVSANCTINAGNNNIPLFTGWNLFGWR